MKEIGGFFELENFAGEEYYNDLISLNNGTNAVLYLLKTKKRIKKVYIPYFLCDSISNMLQNYGFKFEYYQINSDFTPLFNKSLEEDEYLYIVNYFGQISNKEISFLKLKFERIILDNTQAFFQVPIKGIDTFYSCRKFFGVPDGAYLSTNSILFNDLEVDISKNRMNHILGRFEGTASNYYACFKKTEKLFDDEPIKKMSKLTHNLLSAINYERVRNIREKNYIYLEKKLKGRNKLQLKMPSGPFSYPFYIDNGYEIKKELEKKKIYLPTLWPNVLENTNESSVEYKFTRNILSLPCDQRYKEEDMEYIIKCIDEVIDHEK